MLHYFKNKKPYKISMIAGFKTIHMKPRNINIQNRAVLNDINYQYDHKMYEQGIDFRIEDPTSILFFYC